MTFTWDARTARYRGESGRFVPRAQVRGALDAALASAEQGTATLTESLRAGSVSIADWQLGMAREIKSAHLASAALAKGGFAQMAPADYGRVGARLKEQYGYLTNFAAQVESGEQLLDGTLGTRSRLYVQAARATYHATEQREMEARGAAEERSLLSPADHCSECVAEAAKGWSPLGSLIAVGSRICLSGCRCVFAYRGIRT